MANGLIPMPILTDSHNRFMNSQNYGYGHTTDGAGDCREANKRAATLTVTALSLY